MWNGFSPILIILVVAIVGIVGIGGAYYLGTQQNSIPSPSPSPSVTTSDETVYTESDRSANWKTYTSEKLSGLSFPPFSIQYPPDWKLDEMREEPDLLNMKLSKGDYTIEISQGPYDGALCLFKGDPDFNGPAADLRNQDFTEISTKLGNLRRVKTSDIYLGKAMFSFCGKSANNQYSNPTLIGKIFYFTPENSDKNLLLEMDKIIETLEKK